MHWSEWAILMLGIIFLIPILVLLFFVAMIVWGLILAALDRRRPIIYRETPFGMFEKRHDLPWVGEVSAGGEILTVFVNDRDGEPNPQFLQKLPEYLDRWREWEQTARREVEEINDRHVLSSISEGDSEDVELTLTFAYPEELSDEIVSVDFSQGEIVSSSVTD